MTDSGIPPTGGPHSSSPTSGPENTIPAQSSGTWAKFFPGATPQMVKQITNNFINYSIQQMKASQDQMTQAIKQMQQDQSE